MHLTTTYTLVRFDIFNSCILPPFAYTIIVGAFLQYQGQSVEWLTDLDGALT